VKEGFGKQGLDPQRARTSSSRRFCGRKSPAALLIKLTGAPAE
jgi:hypothetical protein